MNKHCALGLVFLLGMLLYSLEALAPCCGGVCYVGGKCCGSDWYIGCNFTLGVACPNEVLDICLACECSSPNSCNWVDRGADLCLQLPACQVCTYDFINNPSFSACAPFSDCSINGTCYSATQSANNSCCCDKMHCGADYIDDTYATTCKQNGVRDGDICYYGPQTNNCTAQGWACQDGSSVNCTAYEDKNPADNTLTRSVPTVDTCTSICSAQGCCETTPVTCDSDCLDGFCVTATTCQNGPFSIGGAEYYCHNDNKVFYINTNPAPPTETCDDGYNNDCNEVVDGEDVGCVGTCLLSSAEWSSSCAFEGENVQLTVQGNANCAGKSIKISVFEDDEGINDTTFGPINWPESPQTFPTEGNSISIAWQVDREDSPDDEANEDMEYRFKAWITDSGASTFTATALIVKYCAAGDSDCDGEPDDTDECPETPQCALMDEEAAGCSVEQAKTSAEAYNVPGLGFNIYSFALAVLSLSALLAYNFRRIS